MIKEMFKRVGIYYYFLPTYTQGKKIIWDGIDRDGMPFLDHFPEEIRDGKPNSTEMKLKVKSGSLFQVVGSDNIDGIVGTNPVGCIFSEFALEDPKGYDLVRPILRENGGWALINSTPRGYNHFYDLFKMAMGNKDWFCEKLTVNDTRRPDGSPVISAADIQADRDEGMSEELILQEYFCSFSASIPGAYYAAEMRAAKDQGRIGNVPVDSVLEVSTYWDIGIDDSMTMWLVQTAIREIRVVAYHEETGNPFSYFINWLKDWKKKYRISYGDHVLPHDGAARNPQTGISSKKFLQNLVDEHIGGAVKVADRPNNKFVDGIEAVRRLIPKCYFDEKNCTQKTKSGNIVGIESLKQFRKEWDHKKKVYRHVHDFSSHGNDGFQTLALAHSFKTDDVVWRPDRKKRYGSNKRGIA
jgi:phage terminase large subunit